MEERSRPWGLVIALIILLLGTAVSATDRDICNFCGIFSVSEAILTRGEKPWKEEQADQPRLYGNSEKVIQAWYPRKWKNAGWFPFLILKPMQLGGIKAAAIIVQVNNEKGFETLSDGINEDRGPPVL